jgi:hypothetical protein
VQIPGKTNSNIYRISNNLIKIHSDRAAVLAIKIQPAVTRHFSLATGYAVLDHLTRVVQAQPSEIAQTIGILAGLNAYLLLMAEEMFDKDLSEEDQTNIATSCWSS